RRAGAPIAGRAGRGAAGTLRHPARDPHLRGGSLMAKPIGTYSFLSYLRVGLANKISQPDQDPIKLRATFDLSLKIEGQAIGGGGPLADTITKPVQLYAPGDIVGIERRAIFKTEPLEWVTNFESNYLPY